MASLALTRPIYSQEGKIFLLQIYIGFISHKQLNHPSSLLFKEKLSFDIAFWLLNQMWIIFNSLGYALHRKWELPFWLLRAPAGAGSFEAAPCTEEPYFASPESKSQALAHLAQSLTFNLNSGSPRWRQSLYVVSFAGENCALIDTWRSAKKRKGNTKQLYNPASTFSRISIICDSLRGELGANERHADFNVTNVLNTLLMEGVWQCRKASMEVSESTEKERRICQDSSS